MNAIRLRASKAVLNGENGRWATGIPWLVLVCLTMLFTGCARYQYRLVEPSQIAQGITKESTRVEQPPLEYHVSERESHLWLAISNPGNEPVTLSGTKSYVVAPQGETHPLGGGTIAPRSYIGLVFPPQPPVYRLHYPFGGFGYGYYGPYWGGPSWGRRYGGFHPGWYGSAFDYPFDPWFHPSYAYAYPENMPHYWDWTTGTVRLRLYYEQGNTNSFDHQFMFERVRVK